MKINQLRKQKVLTVMIAVTFLFTSFGVGPAPATAESGTTTEQSQSADSSGASDSSGTAEDSSAGTPPEATSGEGPSEGNSAVDGSEDPSPSADIKDSAGNDVSELNSNSDPSVNDTSGSGDNSSRENKSFRTQKIETQFHNTLMVEVEVNGSGGIVTLEPSETYAYTWASSNATACMQTSPVESGISLDGHSEVIGLGHEFYPTATSSVTITIACTDGDDTVSDSVEVRLAEVADTIPPVFGSTTDIFVTASTSAGIVVDYDLPTATDNVDTSVEVVCAPASGIVFPVGTTTVTCTATDDAGNTATTTFRVIVSLPGIPDTGDDMPPVIAPHADVFATATTSAGVIVNFTNPTATDDTDTSVDVVCAPSSGTNFAVGTTTVICTATDDAGNTASTSFNVIVSLAAVDDEPPFFLLKETVFATTTNPAGIVVNYSLPMAIDTEDSSVPVTCEPISGAMFPVGTTTVTCTATDSDGNTATGIFHVVVILVTTPGDTTPPVIGPHADVFATASTSAGVSVDYSLPTTTDNIDTSVSLVCTPASGSVFPVGTTTVTCVAMDDAGNTATSTFRVIVTLDTGGGGDDNPPFFNLQPTIFATTTNPAGIVVEFENPMAFDDIDPSVDVVCTPVSGSFFPVGTSTVTCTATDDAGNTTQATFQVVVILVTGTTTPIVVTGGLDLCVASSSVALSGTAGLGTVLSITGGVGTVMATTSAAGTWSAVVDLSGATTSVLSISALDAMGIVVASTSVDVLFDTGAPTITLNGTSTMSISQGTVFVDPGVTVTDELDASASVTASGTVNVNVPGTYTITYTAVDCAGNTTTITRTVIVTPVIPIIEVGGLACAATTTVIITGTAATGTVVTLVGGTGTFLATTTAAGTWSASVSLTGAATTTPFAITVRDAMGHVLATDSIDVTLDTEAPVITLNGDSTITIEEGDVFNDPGVTVTDNLDASTTVTATGTVDVNTEGTYTITYTAVDCAGNVTTLTRTVVVEDDGGGGGGSRRRSVDDDDDDDDDGSNVGTVNTGDTFGIGGIGGAAGFLPAAAFFPTSTFFTPLGFVPGIPNTGAGGEMATNLALLIGSLSLTAAGFRTLRKKMMIEE